MSSFARSVLKKGLAFLVVGPLLIALPLAAAQANKTRAVSKTEGKYVGASSNAKAPLPQREPFSGKDQDLAVVSGAPDVRVWGDSEEDFRRAVGAPTGPWLSLSGGGADGAFGAGLLAGWTRSGTRPDFAVVSGVSTGALIAPYAFLGAGYDEELHIGFTTINAGSVFELNSTPKSLLDTWPLKDLIAKKVTPELLAAIAAEHRQGRRLFVVTTNLDAGRPVLWNMGAIAAHGGDRMLRLFRDVLLASASIPGLFPPVAIETEATGRIIQEMHGDGTLNAPFYTVPESMLSGTATAALPLRELYVIVNGKLTSDFSMPEQNTLSILGRSLGLAFQFGIRLEIARVHAATARSGIGFNLAFVDAAFDHGSQGAFDTRYMAALYDLGLKKGAGISPFSRVVTAPAITWLLQR